jgi:putative flippase GtrA
MAAFAGNVIILMGAVELFGVDYRIANLVGIAVGTVINFTAGEVWIFRSRGGGRNEQRNE